MPRMSDTMEEGVIVEWLKNVGDTVEPGDTLAEVETDKATMELDSYSEGVLLHIAVKEGAVPINGVIAVIGEKGEDWKAAIDAADNETSPAASPSPEPSNANTSSPQPVSTPEVQAVATAPTTNTDKRIKASPLAKSMAAEANIDLSTVVGTGDQGRIVKKDVEVLLGNGTKTAPKAAPASPTAPVVQSFVPASTGDNFKDVPLSQMRKTIARRLGESKFSAPHFYLTVEIDMGNSMASRKSINEIAPTKISFNDLVVKAVAIALRQHPNINSSWLDDRIRYNGDINIGVAVAVDEGLLVPVIRYADMKTLSQINAEVRELAGKAKEKKLGLDEMQGNTFTISNLGMFGIEEFTAIINPPDACILAVGSIIQKAVVKDGELAVGNMMKVTLSCDHRVVDGVTGAKFLQTLKSILEDPIRMIV